MDLSTRSYWLDDDQIRENSLDSYLLVHDIVKGVREDLVGGFSPYRDSMAEVNKHATPSEKKEIIARIRPYAERDYADPYARFIMFDLWGCPQMVDT